MSDFKFKMEGPAFEEGIPLPIALSSLQDVEAIFDKTYLVVTGGKKITKKDRANFYLNTYDIKHGSLETDLQVIYEVAKYTLPVIATYSPSDILDLTQQGWDFLKFIYGLALKGEKPMYEANDNATINVYNGDVTKVYNSEVVEIGTVSVNNWRSLNHKLKDGYINNYSMGSENNPEVTLTSDLKEIFDNPTHIETTPVDISCDIFDFNKRNNAGKLFVTDSAVIPEGDYSFSVIGSQDRIEYISSMARPEITAVMLKEVSINPLGDTTIVKLHIIEVHP